MSLRRFIGTLGVVAILLLPACKSSHEKKLKKAARLKAEVEHSCPGARIKTLQVRKRDKS